MFCLHDRATRLCDGVSRRQLLQAGGLSLCGLTLPRLLQAADENQFLGATVLDKTFGRAKNVIFLYLAGGPPQHETFDPKPEAPVEIRGAFKPISTNVPGIQFCELLPRTANIADKLAIVRSMATDDNIHSSSGHWVLTGYKYQGPNARTLQATDWPYLGSVVKKLKPSEVLPPLSTVWIPDMNRLNESVTPAGQTGGLLGGQWDPDRFVGDPSDPSYKVEGLNLSGMSPLRLKQRQSLLSQVDSHFDTLQRGKAVKLYDGYQKQAFDLMTSGKARAAFDISKEPEKVRQRYGRNRWGQCVLLARRLIEAGVRLVHVQWPREPGDNAVDNPLWDTHAQNADRVEDVLCPQFDVGFSALIEDLQQRGLLEETLVVAIGEFGRTPKINAKGGRDHWGSVFSFVLAGAGISGGQVYGASDKQGGYPARDRVEPGDLTGTIFHLLGLDAKGTFHDQQGLERPLTLGKPLLPLLGLEPATRRRVASTGDVLRVPPFDPDKILSDVRFDSGVPLRGIEGSSRPKGWRADPFLKAKPEDRFGVALVGKDNPAAKKIGPHAAIGIMAGEQEQAIAKGVVAFLAQEVRSPFAGDYVLSTKIRGEAPSQADFENIFGKNFIARLVLFEFAKQGKSPAFRKELASLGLTPQWFSGESTDFDAFELPKRFASAAPGSNFSFGLGLGVAIIVEKISDGILNTLSSQSDVVIRIAEVKLEFKGKERNKDVKV